MDRGDFGFELLLAAKSRRLQCKGQYSYRNRGEARTTILDVTSSETRTRAQDVYALKPKGPMSYLLQVPDNGVYNRDTLVSCGLVNMLM